MNATVVPFPTDLDDTPDNFVRCDGCAHLHCSACGTPLVAPAGDLVNPTPENLLRWAALGLCEVAADLELAARTGASRPYDDEHDYRDEIAYRIDQAERAFEALEKKEAKKK